MTSAEVVDLARDAIFVLLKIAGPIMLIALGVGLLISLFQALTQIQELTLTFVPKMIAIFLSLLILMPFMMASMSTFMEEIATRIANLQ